MQLHNVTSLEGSVGCGGKGGSECIWEAHSVSFRWVTTREVSVGWTLSNVGSFSCFHALEKTVIKEVEACDRELYRWYG